MTLVRSNLPGFLPGMKQAPGRAWPMGASVDAGGVNFAVFSANAHLIELCQFSADGRKELARMMFPDRDGDIWSMYVDGMKPGQLYGLRVHGPYEPEAGHRFNPHKLLMDPYARSFDGRLRWSDALMGYRIGSARGDLSYDTRDSAFAVPKSVVGSLGFIWGKDAPPHRPWSETVIYEAHVKGMTARHPGVEPQYRGTYLGIGSPAVIDHLVKLGVTAVELLPVQSFFDDRLDLRASLPATIVREGALLHGT